MYKFPASHTSYQLTTHDFRPTSDSFHISIQALAWDGSDVEVSNSASWPTDGSNATINRNNLPNLSRSLDVPSNVSVYLTDDDDLTFSWDAVSGATDYELRFRVGHENRYRYGNAPDEYNLTPSGIIDFDERLRSWIRQYGYPGGLTVLIIAYDNQGNYNDVIGTGLDSLLSEAGWQETDPRPNVDSGSEVFDNEPKETSKPSQEERGTNDRQKLKKDAGIDVVPSDDRVSANLITNDRGQVDRNLYADYNIPSGYLSAVDVFDGGGTIDKNNPTTICFPEANGYLMILDASGHGMKPLRALDVFYEGGDTCAELTFPGTVLLLYGNDISEEFWRSYGGTRVSGSTGKQAPGQEPKKPQKPYRPSTPLEPPAEVDTGKKLTVTQNTGVNLRASAGLGGSSVSTLGKGAEVTILEGPELRDGYYWYHVRAVVNGRTVEGWVAYGSPRDGSFFDVVAAPEPDPGLEVAAPEPDPGLEAEAQSEIDEAPKEELEQLLRDEHNLPDSEEEVIKDVFEYTKTTVKVGEVVCYGAFGVGSLVYLYASRDSLTTLQVFEKGGKACVFLKKTGNVITVAKEIYETLSEVDEQELTEADQKEVAAAIGADIVSTGANIGITLITTKAGIVAGGAVCIKSGTVIGAIVGGAAGATAGGIGAIPGALVGAKTGAAAGAFLTPLCAAAGGLVASLYADDVQEIVDENLHIEENYEKFFNDVLDLGEYNIECAYSVGAGDTQCLQECLSHAPCAVQLGAFCTSSNAHLCGISVVTGLTQNPHIQNAVKEEIQDLHDVFDCARDAASGDAQCLQECWADVKCVADMSTYCVTSAGSPISTPCTIAIMEGLTQNPHLQDAAEAAVQETLDVIKCAQDAASGDAQCVQDYLDVAESAATKAMAVYCAANPDVCPEDVLRAIADSPSVQDAAKAAVQETLDVIDCAQDAASGDAQCVQDYMDVAESAAKMAVYCAANPDVCAEDVLRAIADSPFVSDAAKAAVQVTLDVIDCAQDAASGDAQCVQDYADDAKSAAKMAVYCAANPDGCAEDVLRTIADSPFVSDAAKAAAQVTLDAIKCAQTGIFSCLLSYNIDNANFIIAMGKYCVANPAECTNDVLLSVADNPIVPESVRQAVRQAIQKL